MYSHPNWTYGWSNLTLTNVVIMLVASGNASWGRGWYVVGRSMRFGLASSLPNQVLVKEKENKESRKERLPHGIHYFEWDPEMSSYKLSFQFYLVPILLYSVYTEFFIYFFIWSLFLHKVLLGTSFTILDSLIYNLSWVWKEVSLWIHFGSDMYWQH